MVKDVAKAHQRNKKMCAYLSVANDGRHCGGGDDAIPEAATKLSDFGEIEGHKARHTDHGLQSTMALHVEMFYSIKHNRLGASTQRRQTHMPTRKTHLPTHLPTRIFPTPFPAAILMIIWKTGLGNVSRSYTH